MFIHLVNSNLKKGGVMGVIRLFSSCSDDSCREHKGRRVSNYPRRKSEIKQEMKIVGNPNPCNFQIVRCESVGHFVVALVRYPECLNFEGQKILVFEGISEEVVKNLDSIDPHFCDSDHPSPVARFVPTHRGWDYAIQFCKSQSKHRR
jgi:hypothetical protein